MESNQKDHIFIPVCILLSIITIAGILLSSNYSLADSKHVTASVIVPEACTMTSTNSVPHTATLSPNTYSGSSGSEYADGIGKTTFTIICNDSNGFSIYAIGYTGDSYEGENHTKLVGANTGQAISTKAYATGDAISNWSMKLKKETDATISYNPQNLTITNDAEGPFDAWHSIPDTYTKVAEYYANTGSSFTDATLGVKLETTYAAYIAQNQPADTYVGQVEYTMVHPYSNMPKDGPMANCPANSICYSPNANDVEGTMGEQPIGDSATSIMLLASNFSRRGYGFAGWSDKYDYSNDNGAKFYGPQETISFDAGKYSTTNGGLRLYAIWIKSQGSIQDKDKVTSVCNSLTTAPTDGTANLSSVSAFTDSRDNETYAIARLADDNCWMIENLRLESTAEHNSDGALAQGYGASVTYGNFAGLADAESTTFLYGYSANSLYSNDGSNNTVNISTLDYPAQRMPRYNNLNTPANAYGRPKNPTSNRFANNNTDAGMYSYGNYYTWHAAIADLTYNGGDNQSTIGTSLCPAGWYLPLGGGRANMDVSNLWKQSRAIIGVDPLNIEYDHFYYSGTPAGVDASIKIRAFPNNYLYSGYFGASSAYGRGENGYYWSSTANSDIKSYTLYFSNDTLYPGTYNSDKHAGRTIRCIMRN